jgi:hypothetical protein
MLEKEVILDALKKQTLLFFCIAYNKMIIEGPGNLRHTKGVSTDTNLNGVCGISGSSKKLDKQNWQGIMTLVYRK